MGWFGGWFGGGSDESNPLGRLDPKLREYLERESPVKYTTVTDQQRQEQEQQRQSQERLEQQKKKEKEERERERDPNAPVVPPQSLFQDGRYAHLWKTYRPQAEIEAEGKSDHEKLQDVLEAFKERKSMIGRAALENCADEQMEWNNCMKYGDWSQRATMCSAEVRRFERCYMMNSRLLKALGYMSSYQRGPEAEEQIQMRADAIFHKMLAQEAEAEKARAEGRPVPKFEPLIKREEKPTGVPLPPIPASVEGEISVEPDAEKLKKWREKLEKLPERDRDAEMEALRADYRAKVETAVRVHELWEQQAKEREQRKAEGKETIKDRVKELFGR